MDQVEYCARISVIRGVGFAALGIGLTMFALMYEPSLSLRAGAVMLGIVAAVLAIKGYNADRTPYKRTEVWLMLDWKTDLPEERIQQIISAALRNTYLHTAKVTSYLAVTAWGLALVAATDATTL